MIQIRKEQFTDASAIGRLTVEAFSQSTLGHHGESDLIEAIRAAQPAAISLVAIDDEHVIGHLLSSPARLESPSKTIHGTAIGPVSVLPKFQRQGVGSALIRELIAASSRPGIDFVAVAGHPGYYPRFDFLPLSSFGIQHCFKGMRDELFFIRWLGTIDYTGLNGCLLKYCDEFGPQDRFS